MRRVPGKVVRERPLGWLKAARPGRVLPGTRGQVRGSPGEAVRVEGRDQPAGDERRRGRHVELGRGRVPEQVQQVRRNPLRAGLLAAGGQADASDRRGKRKPKRTWYTVASTACPRASIVGVAVIRPSEASRTRARVAAVGETPARRAASRTDATPRGDRDSAASTRVSTGDRSGTGGIAPSSRASASTCSRVSRNTPEAVRSTSMPSRSTARRTRGAEVPSARAAAARL